jgi:centrin-2/centrin-1
MVSLGFDTRNKAVFDMINELDKDQSGKIDFQEYLDLMTHRVSAKDSKEALSKVFKLYDE